MYLEMEADTPREMLSDEENVKEIKLEQIEEPEPELPELFEGETEDLEQVEPEEY